MKSFTLGNAQTSLALLSLTRDFVMNMEEKLQDEEFLADTDLILGPEVEYEPQDAWRLVHDELVTRLIREK